MTRGKRRPRNQTIGKRLAEERERQGLTLRGLAEMAGVSKNTPHLVETGHSAASMAVIEALASALGVSPSWLAFGEGAREPVPTHFRKVGAQLAEWLDTIADPRGKVAAGMLRTAYGLTEPGTDEGEEE